MILVRREVALVAEMIAEYYVEGTSTRIETEDDVWDVLETFLPATGDGYPVGVPSSLADLGDPQHREDVDDVFRHMRGIAACAEEYGVDAPTPADTARCEEVARVMRQAADAIAAELAARDERAVLLVRRMAYARPGRNVEHALARLSHTRVEAMGALLAPPVLDLAAAPDACRDAFAARRLAAEARPHRLAWQSLLTIVTLHEDAP